MAQIKSGQKDARNSAKGAGKSVNGFTDKEKAAMRERVQELKAGAHRGGSSKRNDGDSDVLAKLTSMTGSDRVFGERIHAIIKATAPSLTAKLWYGMPAYANADGNVVCFFQDARKFKSRYATLGFSDKAHLDEGVMWPTSYALKDLTAAEEARIVALVKKAVS